MGVVRISSIFCVVNLDDKIRLFCSMDQFLSSQILNLTRPQTSNSYFICDDAHIIDRIFTRIRNYDGKVSPESRLLAAILSHRDFQAAQNHPTYPQTIAGLSITGVCDLTTGYDSSNPPEYKPKLPLSSGHMIQFRAQSQDGINIVLTTR